MLVIEHLVTRSIYCAAMRNAQADGADGCAHVYHMSGEGKKAATSGSLCWAIGPTKEYGCFVSSAAQVSDTKGGRKARGLFSRTSAVIMLSPRGKWNIKPHNGGGNFAAGESL